MTTDSVRVELVYLNDDDGVWLRCEQHGLIANLGFFPTPADAVKAEQTHRQSEHEGL